MFLDELKLQLDVACFNVCRFSQQDSTVPRLPPRQMLKKTQSEPASKTVTQRGMNSWNTNRFIILIYQITLKIYHGLRLDWSGYNYKSDKFDL